MKRIQQIIDGFEVSRPIFKATVDGGRLYVEIRSPVYPYIPTVAEGDFEAELAAEVYGESFSIKSGKFSVNPHLMVEVSQKIRLGIVRFVDKNLQAKAPRQTKLYRWVYSDMPTDDNFNEKLFLIYKYIKSFTNDDMRCKIGIGNFDHANNAINLLTAIMEKYEQK